MRGIDTWHQPLDAMINTPALQALRKPVQSLQDTCASLFGAARKRPAEAAKSEAASSANAAPESRYDATQWAPTNWAETSMEPRLP
jgi:hypothetical protein